MKKNVKSHEKDLTEKGPRKRIKYKKKKLKEKVNPNRDQESQKPYIPRKKAFEGGGNFIIENCTKKRIYIFSQVQCLRTRRSQKCAIRQK